MDERFLFFSARVQFTLRPKVINFDLTIKKINYVGKEINILVLYYFQMILKKKENETLFQSLI